MAAADLAELDPVIVAYEDCARPEEGRERGGEGGRGLGVGDGAGDEVEEEAVRVMPLI